MPTSNRLRYEIFRRDDFACRYCGGRAPDVELTVDHVVPVALGGNDDPQNLVTACATCNSGKASSAPDAPLVAAVSDDALRWSAAMARAAEIQNNDQRQLAAFSDDFERAWGGYYSLPQDWRQSVEHWHSLGADRDFLCDCIDMAFAARGVEWRWKYFCGIVWRRLDERQQIARELLTEPND